MIITDIIEDDTITDSNGTKLIDLGAQASGTYIIPLGAYIVGGYACSMCVQGNRYIRLYTNFNTSVGVTYGYLKVIF